MHNTANCKWNDTGLQRSCAGKNGSSITITPIGFDVTRLVRQWYNTGKNYGIMVKSAYENDSTVANRAYARFYSSDHPTMASDQYPSGVFYYRMWMSGRLPEFS